MSTTIRNCATMRHNRRYCSHAVRIVFYLRLTYSSSTGSVEFARDSVGATAEAMAHTLAAAACLCAIAIGAAECSLVNDDDADAASRRTADEAAERESDMLNECVAVAANKIDYRRKASEMQD